MARVDRGLPVFLVLTFVCLTGLLAGFSVVDASPPVVDASASIAGMDSTERLQPETSQPETSQSETSQSETSQSWIEAPADVRSGTVDSTAGGGERIVLVEELALTDEPGSIEVRVRVTIPEPVSAFEVDLPERATVTNSRGFEAEGDRTYAWDERTEEPELHLSVAANRTTEGSGPIAGQGNHLFVDTGEWALVTRTEIGVRWREREPVSLNRTLSTAGPGAAGGTIAFLGEHEEHTRTAHGQTFQLIVPERANLAEEESEILNALADASDALRVGDRDPTVFVVAAPTGEVEWGVRGLQAGEADLWVEDGERLADPDSVWLHEYVHTRQSFRTTAEVRWFTEASATYYAALITLERGDIDFPTFRERLASGERLPHRTDVLADPTTWTRSPDYHKGALLTGELDRRIRLATESERSLQTVFQRMNAHEGTVTQSDFLGMVESAGDGDVREIAREYTETRNGPSTWTATDHEEAFGTDPARIEYRLAAPDEPDAQRVTGAYRNRSLGSDRPIVLVPDETLSLQAVVQNAGGMAGDYDLSLRVDGTIVATERGRIAPGETIRHSFERTFTSRGTYRLAVADDEVAVHVLRPAEATVGEESLDSTTVDPGEPITATALVSNSQRIPGEAIVELEVDGEVREAVTVRLDAGAERTVSLSTVIEEPGTYDVRIGAKMMTVTVTGDGSERIEDDSTDSTSIEQPGFGVAVAFIAICLALLARAITVRYR